MMNAWKINKLCVILLLGSVACGTPDGSLKAITDETLSLGLVRVDAEGKEFNLLLCRWQKTYSQEALAKHCVPALVDDAGEAAVIPRDFPNKRTQMQVAGSIKWAISVAVLAAVSFAVSKKIRKMATRIRNKNLDMNSMSSIQKLKLEADANLSRAQSHYDSVQERLKQVKELRKENYYDNGVPPNDRRFIPLLRTTDYKAYVSLETASKRAKKALEHAKTNANKANSMHENAKILYQWNIDQSDNVVAFKDRLLKDLEKINVNTVIIKNGAESYTYMPVAKLRNLIATHTEQIAKLKEELAMLEQADSKKLLKKKEKLQAQIEAHELMLAKNTGVIPDLEATIKSMQPSEPRMSMSSKEHKNLYNKTMDTATDLKSNNLFQLMVAGASSVIMTKLIEPLSFWGRDERSLANYWYALFYQHSDMDYATPAIVDIRATLKIIANRIFPQFHLNPEAEKMFLEARARN